MRLGPGDVADHVVAGGVGDVDLGDHLPEIQHRDVIGDLEDVRQVVADDDHRDTLLGEPLDEVEHLLGLGDAERGRRLVEDHHACLLQHRAGDRDGLALAAGQGGDLLAHRLDGAHGQAAKGVGRVLLHAALVERAERELLATEEHVLDDVEVVAQREVLVHDLDAEVRGIARRVQVAVDAVDEDLALVVGLHAGETLDEGRLSGAVVADQGGDLAGVDLEVHALEDADRTERFLHADQLDDRLCCSDRL